MNKNNAGSGTGMPEFLRKFLVSLKRKPQMIPLVMLVVTFLEYSLNLTCISNTTAKIQGPGMGLCGFVIMLFSMLSLVCFLNAFPHRKPVNKPMLIIMFVMFVAIFAADTIYLKAISNAVTRVDNPIVINESTFYIEQAKNYLNIHRILLGVSIVLIALLPVYSKWIRKIRTSIEVEENQDMAEIDISGEA